MRKRLLSILLLCCMVLTLLPTTALAEEAAPAFDLATDLADITIPNNLVTCVCTKANETKQYGQLTNGFSATKVAKEGNVWTVLISVKPDVYMAQFNKDTGSTHSPDGDHSNDFTTPIQFKLKYEENKWVLEGEMPQNKTLHFTCSGGHVYQGDIPVIKVVTRTSTDIKVTENNAWEYSIDNGATWQGSCHFTNLQPGTEYTIIARVRETATHKPSANSAPLTVTTMHLAISDELKDKLRAVASAYEGEYNGKEHEAVIVDDTEMPKGWRIAGYTTDEGNSFSNNIPEIKDAGTLRVGVKFVHPDYLMNITHYYTAEITPKPVTAGMIADIPSQHYTGHPIYPTPVIKDGNTPLVKDKDFTYSYDTNTSPEQGGKVTINGKGNYKGMASKSFNIVNEITEITEDDLKDLEIPTLVTVKCTTTKDEGNSFSNNIPEIKDAGTLRVGVKFVHPDYLMNITHYYTAEITPKPVTAGMIADIPSQHYTGHPIYPTPVIKDGNTPLVKDKDFTYSYDTNTSPEQGGKVTINGKGNYKGMASKSFNIVNEITEITEDDLKDLEIPTLVTVKCTTTNSSKEYGRIPGGFDLSKSKPYMDNGVLKAIVYLNLPAYKAKYDADTKKKHEIADFGGNLVTTFTLKYVNDKWELDGTFPNVIILVKCDGQHPQTLPYPTEENVGGLEQVQVRVQCSTDRTQFKNYGILPGSVSIMPDPNNPSQATLTLIPSVYSTQYSTDTGITHIVDPNQTADNLKIQMRYDPAVGKWMPAGELTPLEVLVQCNNHQGQRYTITFKGNGGSPSVTSMATIDQKLPELPTATHSGRYSFDGWYTEKNGGTKITTATLFDKDTTVYAHWTYTGSTGGGGVTTYPITVKSAKNGDVTANHKSAAKGTTITLTVDPDKGYVLDTLTVLDGKDKDLKLTEKNGKFTFTMPASKVTVAATFKTSAPTGKNPFVDVPAGSYYEDAVIWAVGKGITTGTSATTFNPNGICTRAQAVTFLWRAAGSPAAKSAVMPFTDVKAGSYYYDAVLWAVEQGITKGTSDTMFSPDATCTRAQIVTFLWRSQKSPAAGMANPFADVAADTYYIDAVLWAVKHNITVGTTVSIFSPDEECTRAQIVTFLYRAHNK